MGGEPRYFKDPATRIEDFPSAVDYLVTLNYVDERSYWRIGICRGGVRLQMQR